MNRFSHIFELDRNKMAVDPNLFQGRQSEYSTDTVNAIVRKGTYDKSGAPIIVWYDAVLDKYLVISGHSRFEATSQLYLAGDKSLQTIPVKEFMGDKDAAIDYAVLESNRSGTEEGLKSDILAFRRAVQTGKNKDYLKSVFKPESKLHKLQKLYFLNPEGEFIHWLTKESSQSFPFLERNAIWVGELRSQLPSLSDSHEKEIFDWLYNSGSKKQLELKKADFYKKIDNRVNRIDFDPSQPLNLENHVSSNVYADPLNEEIKAIDAEIEKLKKETDRNRENIVRARAEKKDELIPKFQNRIKEIDALIIRKIGEREDLRVQIGKLERNIVADLFSMDDTVIEKPKFAGISKPEVKDFKIGNQSTFYHASSNKRTGRLKLSTAQQFGTGIYFSTNKSLVENEFGQYITSAKLDLQNPVYTNTKEWQNVEKLAITKANLGKAKNSDGDIIDEEYDIYEIKAHFISDAAKELGHDAIIDEGSNQYENEILVLDESKIIYLDDTPAPVAPVTPVTPVTKEGFTEAKDLNKDLPIGGKVTSTLKDYGQTYTLTYLDGMPFLIGDKDGKPISDGGKFLSPKTIAFIFGKELKESIANQPKVEKAKPIRQLGTGSNVYFETDKYRVNESYKNNEIILLNVGGLNSLVPIAHYEFDNASEAVHVAKTLEAIYPKGVPDAVLINKVVDNIKKAYKGKVNTAPSPRLRISKAKAKALILLQEQLKIAA